MLGWLAAWHVTAGTFVLTLLHRLRRAAPELITLQQHEKAADQQCVNVAAQQHETSADQQCEQAADQQCDRRPRE